MNKTPFRFTPAVALLVLAGCGGHDHHDGSSSSDATSLAFSAVSADYNGTSGQIAGTATATAGSSNLVVVLTDGNRTVTATVPIASVQAGATVAADYSSENVLYRETDSSSVYRQWAAVTGSFTITKISGGLATVRVDALAFKPCGCSGNLGAGTFQADGTIANVPLG